MPLSDDPAVRSTATDRRTLWQRRLQDFVRGADASRSAPTPSGGVRGAAR